MCVGGWAGWWACSRKEPKLFAMALAQCLLHVRVVDDAVEHKHHALVRGLELKIAKAAICQRCLAHVLQVQGAVGLHPNDFALTKGLAVAVLEDDLLDCGGVPRLAWAQKGRHTFRRVQ